jgi:CHASE1-domain containing sensor protein
VGQSWTAVAVILGIAVLVMVLLLALCAIGSRLELRRDERKAREREAGGEP